MYCTAHLPGPGPRRLPSYSSLFVALRRFGPPQPLFLDRSFSRSLFQPPESIEDARRSPTPAVDIYAFAIFLWMLVTTREPFAVLTDDAIRFGVVYRRLRPPMPRPQLRFFRAGAAADPHRQAMAVRAVNAILEGCWAQQPEERPTAGEVVAALDDLLSMMVG